jgi:hypothetical protein
MANPAAVAAVGVDQAAAAVNPHPAVEAVAVVEVGWSP